MSSGHYNQTATGLASTTKIMAEQPSATPTENCGPDRKLQTFPDARGMM
jgi:hypothetical protein